MSAAATTRYPSKAVASRDSSPAFALPEPVGTGQLPAVLIPERPLNVIDGPSTQWGRPRRDVLSPEMGLQQTFGR
jgi:hypothetical protein